MRLPHHNQTFLIPRIIEASLHHWNCLTMKSAAKRDIPCRNPPPSPNSTCLISILSQVLVWIIYLILQCFYQSRLFSIKIEKQAGAALVCQCLALNWSIVLGSKRYRLFEQIGQAKITTHFEEPFWDQNLCLRNQTHFFTTLRYA